MFKNKKIQNLIKISIDKDRKTLQYPRNVFFYLILQQKKPR